MEWSVSEPRKLVFDDPVTALSVRIVDGTVNVVGTDGAAHLEISGIQGPPLVVTQEGSTLTVAYEDLPWKGFLKWLDPQGWRRKAVVSVAVPAGAAVEVGVVSAGAVVSGIRGRTDVRASPATPRSSASRGRSAPSPCPATWRPRPSAATSTSSRCRAT